MPRCPATRVLSLQLRGERRMSPARQRVHARPPRPHRPPCRDARARGGARAPAAAQPEWSPPQRVSGPQASQIVTLDHDGAGGGLLIWSAQPGPFYDTAHRPAGDSAWQAGPRLPSRLALHAKPAVSLPGVSRALPVASRRGGEGDSLRYAMVAAFGRSDGTFGALRPLNAGAIEGRDAPRSLSSPALAASPRSRSTPAATASWPGTAPAGSRPACVARAPAGARC